MILANGLFLAIGTFFLFAAAVGAYRMPDAYNQLHCITLAATIGLVNLLLAAVLYLGSVSVLLHSLLVLVFHFMTAPVSGHMIARVKHPDSWEGTGVDELGDNPTMCHPEGADIQSEEPHPAGSSEVQP